jgi:hypothetical protein
MLHSPRYRVLRRLTLFAAPAALLANLPRTANASVIYDYTGQPFTAKAISPYTTSDSVSGSMTLATALAPNLSNSDISPTAFSFSDGEQTINQSNVYEPYPDADYYSYISISTDSSGNITAFSDIHLVNDSSTSSYIALYDGDYVQTSNSTYAFNDVAGTWSVAPEPASLGLLSVAAGALLLRRRRKLV